MEPHNHLLTSGNSLKRACSSSPEIEGTDKRPSKRFLANMASQMQAKPSTSRLEKQFHKMMEKSILTDKAGHISPNLIPNFNKRGRNKLVDEPMTTIPTAVSATNALASEKGANINVINEKTNDWISPNKTCKLRVNDKQDTSILTTNSFDSLIDETEASDNDGESEHQSTGNHGDSEHPGDKRKTSAKPSQKNIKRSGTGKMPPINCTGTNIKNLVTQLAAIKKDSYHIRTIELFEYQIITTDMPTHMSIRSALKKANIKYYTYTPTQEKNKLIILKGISSEYNKEEVMNDIAELNIPNVTTMKIIQLGNKESSSKTNDNKPYTATYLIQVTKDSVIKNLINTKKILQQDVRWETYRKNKVFQCRNCQRVGHSSAGCGLGYRCVKCLDEHEPGKCPRNGADKKTTKPSCVNCNKEGHAANYRGCPYLMFAQEKLNEWKGAKIENKEETNKIRRTNSKTKAERFSYDKVQKNCCDEQALTIMPSRNRSNENTLEIHGNGNKGLDKLESLFSNFKNEIFNQMRENNNTTQTQIREQNRKIDFILDNLNLKWE